MMQRSGHLLITLRPGEALPHVPSYLDWIIGACRQTLHLDGGQIDRVLRKHGNGFRAACAYHARHSLGHAGEQHVGFDDIEEKLGLSRTYKIELADSAQSRVALDALRDLAKVESAIIQTLAFAPLATTSADATQSDVDKLKDAWAPHERIHAPEALAIEPGDERVRVAVVDTGIALGHPEFQGALLAGYDTVDLGMGWVNDQIMLVGHSWGPDFTPLDLVGHGSHVAGIIGAQGWRVPHGVAGRSLILPIRVLAAALAGGRGRRLGVGSLPDINAGLKVAVDLRARVIHMSFGTPESSVDPHGSRPHEHVVRYATHYGCVLVAAAGNSGVAENYYPAALPEVIAVGSVDEQGRRSHFSTFGNHIALCAPGERIISVGRHGYKVSTGTSHAAPFVSGVAALLLSRARRAGRELNGAEVRQLLTASAAPLAGGGFSAETGYGLVDARAALRTLEQTLESGQNPGRLR